MQIKPKRPDLFRVRVEKRPGDDWVVDVLVVPENEVYPVIPSGMTEVTVFGARDEQEAIRDAPSSLAPRDSDDLTVLDITRLTDGQTPKTN